jgi:hypothetical protein
MKEGGDVDRGEHPASPIIVVDDSDGDEGRATKKRKVDGPVGAGIAVR